MQTLPVPGIAWRGNGGGYLRKIHAYFPDIACPLVRIDHVIADIGSPSFLKELNDRLTGLKNPRHQPTLYTHIGQHRKFIDIPL